MSGNTIPGMVQPALAVTTTLASQVAQNGTFTINYPTGFTAANFSAVSAVGHALQLGIGGSSQPYYSGPGADFSLAFGTSAITVTWLNAATLASGTVINLSVNQPDNGSPSFTNVTVTGQFLDSVADNLTAYAGGGQANAVQLTAMIDRITTVASAADSVKLPTSAAGMSITVINAAATNSMNVYPVTGDAINALATNAAFALAAGKTAIFFCTTAGRWHSILSA